MTGGGAEIECLYLLDVRGKASSSDYDPKETVAGRDGDEE